MENQNTIRRVLDRGSYQFTLESENQLVFFFQLLQQGLLFVGILQNEQQDAALHIFWDNVDSSDLSVGPYPRQSNIEPKRMTTNKDIGVCDSCCFNFFALLASVCGCVYIMKLSCVQDCDHSFSLCL